MAGMYTAPLTGKAQDECVHESWRRNSEDEDEEQERHGLGVVFRIVVAGTVLLVYWYSTYKLANSPYPSISNHEAHTPPQVQESFDRFYHDYPDTTISSQEPITRSPAYLVKAYRGAVASENGICSGMGVDVLKRGGNAVDAAISTTFCTGVVHMFSTGIGGGGFMIVRIPPPPSNSSSGNQSSSDSDVWSVNFRETAPALANATMYNGDRLKAQYGGLSIAVPGELRGLQEAHRRWGSLPWKELVEPSVELAAKGWRVQKELARRLEVYTEVMVSHPDWKPLFAPNGTLVKEGDWVRRENYAQTLAVIAEQGPDAFYEGPIADSIIKKVRENGGILSHQDLKDYRIKFERPLMGTYRGRKIYTTHAPGAGILLVQILNVLENYDMSKRTPLTVHRIIEAIKYAFSSRTKIYDPMTTTDLGRISKLATKDYAYEIFRNITDDKTHPLEYYNPEYTVPIDHGTYHTSVVDQNGMAVAITSTVNNPFGSLVLDTNTGILMNNQMNDFSIPDIIDDSGMYPSPYNYVEPGKRAVSSTSPAILENEDGSFYACIGGAGGIRIFPSVAQVLLHLDWGMNPSEAIEFGRVHDQLWPMEVEVDEIYPSDAFEFLRQAGHNLTIADINRFAASVHLVMQKDGVFYAASDSRKNGVPVALLIVIDTGLYAILFTISIYVLAWCNKSRQWFLLITTVFMFAIATADITYTVWLLFEILLGKEHFQFRVLYPKYSMFVTNTFVAHALLLYRCVVVWGHNRWLIGLGTFGLISVTGAGYALEGTTLEMVSNGWIYLSLTLILNLALTGLMAGKIFYITNLTKRNVGLLPLTLKRRYMTTIAILIECGVLYTIYLTLNLAFLKQPSANAVLECAAVQVVGIVPTLIVVQVGLGRSASYDHGDEVPLRDSFIVKRDSESPDVSPQQYRPPLFPPSGYRSYHQPMYHT
ncbi:hypothetical protein NP233_g698 [Leucocoprinus birnbaumii]|uniref:Glutathione hydrolase n=1 Tax=Leucocoprinus birnbaumii TaxID=56174 RepID=A0AAD5W3E3_9AGAR|nr:hypothetical protein NP233_g698 [Leucocoprinus birnbaumii]